MKRIEAIIKPFKMEEVKKALMDAGVTGMTTTDVKGFGRQKGHKMVYRGAEYDVDFVPKVHIVVVADDDKAPIYVAAIREAALTGQIGDGKIFVSSIEEALRIRTGETGPSAL